jgi:type IV secretion system protein TrbL
LGGGTVAAYRSGGLSGVVQTGVSTAASPLRRAGTGLKSSFESGGRGVAGVADESGEPVLNDAPPAWARRMRRAQAVSHGTSAATHAIRSGDHGGSGSSVDLSEGGR